MNKTTIEITLDWYQTLKRKNNSKIKLTEYQDGVPSKMKYIRG